MIKKICTGTNECHKSLFESIEGNRLRKNRAKPIANSQFDYSILYLFCFYSTLILMDKVLCKQNNQIHVVEKESKGVTNFS